MQQNEYIPRAVVCIRDYYYTLRESALIQMRMPGGETHRIERLYHVRNLSQDADEAIKLAKHYAAQNGLAFSQSADSLRSEMLAIKRASAEEMQERRRREEEEDRQAAEAREQHQKAILLVTEAEIANGLLVRGRPHWAPEVVLLELGAGATLRGLATSLYGQQGGGWIDMNALQPGDIGYIDWVAKSFARGDFADSPVMTLRGQAVVARFGEKPLPDPVPGVYLGKPGERVALQAVIVSKRDFPVIAYGTGMKTLVKMVECGTGASVIHWNSGMSYGQVGDRVAIKATVKEHEDYKGTAQTVVLRVRAA
ncbi:hypothetical protein AB7849_15665 [Rhodanobacter sp. 115]|uniref:hypothetical protein n=1 Tax=Rhodanobacter sp. FW021-MT20 TaxID=1162282 RepID=UPI0034E5D39F